MVFFECSECGQRISEEVTMLEDKEKLNSTEEEPYLPQGKFLIEDGEFWPQHKEDFIINISDLVKTDIEGEDWSEKTMHYGCCGLGGDQGKNTVCKEGHLIGTKITECVYPHCMILDRDSVRKVTD